MKTKSNELIFLVLAVACLAVLVLAACGDDDDDGTAGAGGGVSEEELETACNHYIECEGSNNLDECMEDFSENLEDCEIKCIADNTTCWKISDCLNEESGLHEQYCNPPDGDEEAGGGDEEAGGGDPDLADGDAEEPESGCTDHSDCEADYNNIAVCLDSGDCSEEESEVCFQETQTVGGESLRYNQDCPGETEFMTIKYGVC